MERHFIVPGEPRGKDRPRFTRNGRTYTTRKTIDYEKRIRTAYQEQYGQMPVLEGPICMVITAIFPIPKSDTKRTRENKLAGRLLPTRKPDTDNIMKAICDALNGIAYKDDSQIVECHLTKQYGEIGMVEVYVEQKTKMVIKNH